MGTLSVSRNTPSHTPLGINQLNQLNRIRHKRVTKLLPYIRGVSENIECICFPLGVKVISKSQDTLIHSLKVKATRPEKKRRVVYEVPCRDCNSVYVGETGRSLEIRLKEYKYAVKMGDTKNGIAVHAWTNEHQVEWDAAKVRACEQTTD